MNKFRLLSSFSYDKKARKFIKENKFHILGKGVFKDKIVSKNCAFFGIFEYNYLNIHKNQKI